MTIEDGIENNKALVRRQFEELINRKNLAIIESDMALDFVDHEAVPDLPPGLAGVREWIGRLHQTCPDLHVTIEDIIAEGDRVVVRNTWRGTHTGPLLGIPPTGKRFELKGIVIWRIASGRICEHWATLDHLGLRQQLAQPDMTRTHSLTAILPSNDLDASEAFYARLGFSPREGDDDYRMLSDGRGGELHLTAAVEGWLVPGRNPFGLYLYVEEVDELAARMGCRAEDKPWGMYEFAVSDPDETLVRVGWPSRLRKRD